MKVKFFSSDSMPLITAPEQSLTERKIKSFSKYTSNWSYGRGIEFSQGTILYALRIVNLFRDYGFNETDAFPGEDGEIMITAYKGDYCCEITAYNEHMNDFIIEEGDSEILREEKINFSNLNTLVKKYRDITTCSSLELSTQFTLTKERKDSEAWPLRIQPEAVFLYFTKIAQNMSQDAFANILKDSTPRYQERQSYSG